MTISTDNKASAAQNFFTLADNLLNIFTRLQTVCNYYADEVCPHWYSFFIRKIIMAKPVFTTKSSTIHKVDYNEKDKWMEIEFRSGNVYRYYDVPPRMWKIFQLYVECEGSAGSFFNEYIKSQFTSEKVHNANSNED